MIVNGQYIKYDEKKAADIQKQLNKQDDVYSNVKSDIQDPQKTVGDEGHSLGFGFSVFDEDETKTTRFERYGYYREMAQMEFINRGLEIVADDSTLDNTEGNVVKFYSNNESIKDSLWELFHNRLDINSELWGIVYETAKMGDNFYEIIPDSYDNPTKIVYLRYLKPEKIDRIEQNGKLLYYTYKTEEDRSEDKSYDPTRVGLGNDESPEKIYKLQPWQIVHFKVKDDKDELPYGASLLKAGIRTYRRLALLEDVILVYRISRAPERRVFYIDVGQMNYTDSKKFIQKIKSQYRTENFLDENGNINRKSNILSTTSDIFVPRREGGQGTQIDTLQGGEALKSIEDLDYFKDKILRLLNIPLAYLGGEADRSRGSLCLAPDTKIKLADGRNLEISEVAKEYNQGKQNYVYSIDEKNEWTIKPVSWAGITQRKAKTIKVKLDNGEEVVATPEHRFMLRDGSYVEAQNLENGTSLMPIYTKYSSKENGDKIEGYERILNNRTNRWNYTHRIAKENDLLEEFKNSKNIVIHHIDFNKINNNPDNLVIMDKKDHFDLHAQVADKQLNTPEVIEKRNESIKRFYATEKGKKIGKENALRAGSSSKKYEYLKSDEHKKLKREQMERQRREGTIYLTEEGRKKISEKTRQRWENPEYRESMRQVCSRAGSIKNKNNPVYRKLTEDEILNTYKNAKMTTQELSDELGISRGCFKKTLRRWGYKDWYEFCEYHNLEPKRKHNHKVASVEEHEVLDEVYDITVDGETPNFALSSGIVVHNSQLDYKFSRFIERIQSQIKRGLNKVAAIELYFNGYKRDDLTNFDIELTPPSNIKEITDIDIMNQRMNLISTVQQTELFSQEWILKNILKLSEKEISDIKLQKQMEQQQGQQGGGEGAAGGGGEFGPAEVGADAGGGGEEAAAGGEEAEGGEAEGGGEEAAGGEEEGAETADTDLSKEQQLTEALVKVLGKEFLIENSEDFFKLMKYLKEDAPNDKVPLFERISEIVRQPVRSEKRGKTPSVRKQMILGEMKGLHYKRDGGRYMKLYEQKRDKEGKTYFEEYENELID
jgi:hypothetical protein